MRYLNIEEDLDNPSTLQDSEYSIGGTVINTALGAGAALGISPAKKYLQRRLTKKAMGKVADGASGVIASKTGVDKESIKGIINGAGQMTGATNGIYKGLTGRPTKLGNAYGDAKSRFDQAKKYMSERLNLQRSFGTGPQNTSTNG